MQGSSVLIRCDLGFSGIFDTLTVENFERDLRWQDYTLKFRQRKLLQESKGKK